MRFIISFTLLSVLLVSCKKQKREPASPNEQEQELFTVLTSEDTGIEFLNELKENTYMNGLLYEYYYNGGGVATADFNNDGLVDIYFVDCLKSNALYLNKGNMKFEDVTKLANASGGYGFGTGVSLVDINNDGLMDIYYSKSGKIMNPDKRRNVLLVNRGINDKGIPLFEDQAAEYDIDFPDFTTQTAFFDYDKDGDLDLFVINHGIELYDENLLEKLIEEKSEYRGERLYQNNSGKFTNVSDRAGIINNMLGFGLGLAISDVNNDTWPDVYVSNDFSEKDHLYINQKDGTFEESSLESFGHVSNFSMGNDIADINNDGLMDVMSLDMMAEDNYTQKTSMSGMNPEKFYEHVRLGLHHQYMYNALQLNQGVDAATGTPKFSDIAQITGVSSTDWSWAPLLFDMDNDGHKDIFISNGIKRDFRNNDFVNYRKEKQAEVMENKAMETQSYVQDLMAKMPTRQKKNYFYVNDTDLNFRKLELEQPESNSNGAAYADFDNDGDLDMVVNNSSSTSFIYRNNAKGNDYLKIRLKGEQSNTGAIGARIELYTEQGDQFIENYFTRGFQSAMADKLHFGLGKENKVDSVRVFWPNHTFQTLKDIQVNQTLSIAYEKDKVREYTPPTSNRPWFNDITGDSNIDFVHSENDFNDYEKEILLPHRMSRLGPALAVADINGDGLDDFFVGGASNQESFLYIQNKEGKFTKKKGLFSTDKNHEDVGAVFFDADMDGDKDLYVISGGSEKEPGNSYYSDRLYENVGNGSFVKTKNGIPEITNSGLRVAPSDFDKDGDIDLFIGGRILPGRYGRPSRSYLLENQSSEGKILFVDVTEALMPEMMAHSMITSAVWADIDQDGRPDLLVANEWGPIELYVNKSGGFENQTEAYGLQDHVGWWSSLVTNDIDNDGDLDIVAGNLGLNYKYKASFEDPFYMYINDFDNSGNDDIVLGYESGSTVYPVRGRQCSSDQMPFIKKKFKTYNEFGNADVSTIYGEKLEAGLSYKATDFATSFLINEGGSFTFKPLPNKVQLSSVNEILIHDYNNDSIQDILLLGNLYGSEVETPRNDASYGSLLKGTANGSYELVSNNEAGLWAGGDVKNAALVKMDATNAILIARNNDQLSLLKINPNL